MRASDLKPVPGSTHKKKRIGRGNASGHGTYSTRGLKGQKSRSGRDLRIGFEGGQNPLVRALSRKRGFNNRFRTDYEVINVSDLKAFASGETLTPLSLRVAGVVKSARLPVKLLADGEVSVALTVEVDRVSASARSKIEAAGGSVTELSPRVIKEKKTKRKTAPKPRAEEPEETEAPAAEAEAPAVQAESQEEEA